MQGECIINKYKYIAYYAVLLIIIIIASIKFDFDSKAIALFLIVFGYISNLFAIILTIIGSIPIIGPIVVQVLSAPILWIINSISSAYSLYIVKQGMGKELADERKKGITILFWIAIGYILGHIIPIK
tara:strand:- start:866 stop:1249 length:384 start_codon:yes stop_codon:yes gene_type:complete